MVDEALAVLMSELEALPEEEQIEAINKVRVALHEVSTFRDEPVDCVLWVRAELVEGNAYNPNTVAPAEMDLLEHSIRADGYTQPIVAWDHDDGYEVVDGFHRNLIGKEVPDIKERLCGYLPITVINRDRRERPDRIAATIRHNRARGRHRVDAMSEIVQELARRRWTNEKIAKELGMDADEVLRLKQISGLAEMFSDREFSRAWELTDGD